MTTPQEGRSPYPGLAPFGEGDADYFFGREPTQRSVRANLFANRLTVLYAASGVGKSSLLHAGVLPALRASTDLPRPLVVALFDRWWGDMAIGLQEVLIDAAAHRFSVPLHLLPGMQPLPALIAALSDEARYPPGCDLMVILDQVEDLLLAESAEAAAVLRELAAVIADHTLPVNILLGVREDAFARLDRLDEQLPLSFATALRLDRLDRTGAEAAIRKPLARYGEAMGHAAHVDIEDALVDAVLSAARWLPAGRDRTEGYEAPILQLILSRLWAEERRASSSLLRLVTLDELGGPEQVVNGHFNHALDDLPAEDQEVVAGLFYYLVTPGGRSIPYTAAELAGYSEQPLVRVEALLDLLTQPDVRILRRVDPPSPDAAPAYAMFHDLLARSATEWRQRFAQRQEIEAAAFVGAATARHGGKPSAKPWSGRLATALARRTEERVPRHELILWVDDLPEQNAYEREALERLGLRFTLSTSTEEALAQLHRHRFAAVISDMGRPDGGRAGYDLLAAMRRRGDDTPVVFYAGSADPEHNAMAQRAGALGSTNDPEVLVDLVLRVIRGARGRRRRP